MNCAEHGAGSGGLFSELPIREVLEIFRKVRVQVPGLIAVALVDSNTGTPLVFESVRADFDLFSACVFDGEMVKQTLNTLEVLGSTSMLREIMVPLGGQVHIVRMVDEGAAFIFLAADLSASNLGYARKVLESVATGAVASDG